VKSIRGWSRLIPLLLLVSACGGKHDEKILAIATGLASSIRASDEAAFLRLHVQPDDMSPSGAFWLATKAGGVRPDAAWDREVLEAFDSLQSDLKAMGVESSTLEFVEVAGGDVYLVSDDKDRQNLQNLRVRMRGGGDTYLFSFSEGMLSQRGWVLTGDPAVMVARENASK
jgi:hypothetical protein